jgi:hypothetical protein
MAALYTASREIRLLHHGRNTSCGAHSGGHANVRGTVATAGGKGRKFFRHPLESKIRFFYFPVAIARWLLGALWARET